MTRAPDVSVVVCAHARLRWRDLQDSVESARAQQDAAEVIVVVDHAPALLRRAQDRWPALTVVESAGAPGLAGARTTGVSAATTEIVAFLDGDVVADADWLTWMLDSFDDPNVAGVGGFVEPVWSDAAGVARLPDELLWTVGCTHGGPAAPTADVRDVLGCSLALRRAAILAVGGFPSTGGRLGALRLDGGATELCIRIHQADPAARIVYEPLSLVHRRVPADRATWRHLWSRSFAGGVSKAALSRALGRTDALSSESSYLTRIVPGALVRELRLIGRGGGKRALAIVTAVAATLGGYALGAVAGAVTRTATGGRAPGAGSAADRAPSEAAVLR
ncbi:hypothetical protein GCM10025867_11690 [Frondihabitans sucicola]|uniref:Glycosyltransferase 2-like domain-containing protein n=1 Tax=Frondihabitans sucicola TaxID=1268041 RepID=A0ABN6XVD8_9MICO|nr:glycosyltransferase family 2 protein [Frondihabitans sucicola]BDZ48928.1 hypothetical protein GCM10025867_11690 [Frondihabitans sucicola]